MLILLFLLWIILNGRITLELVIIGLAVSAAVYCFARAAFGFTLSWELSAWKLLPMIILYLLNLVVEIIKASVSVMGIILNPRRRPDPVLIEFDSGLPTDIQNMILANSITLTPGTITVFMEGSHFQIHCLVPELGEGIGESSFIKLLSRMEMKELRSHQKEDF